jgi:hypothetical protein
MVPRISKHMTRPHYAHAAVSGELDIEPTPGRHDELFQKLSHDQDDFADIRCLSFFASSSVPATWLTSVIR